MIIIHSKIVAQVKFCTFKDHDNEQTKPQAIMVYVSC